MKPKVVLINPRWRTSKLYGFKFLGHGIFMPLGLAYIAGYLDSKGIDVLFVDAEAEKLTDTDVLNKVRIFKPDVIGVTCATSTFPYALSLSTQLKQHLSVPIVFGGVHSTQSPKDVLKYGEIDFVIMGEGEITFYELIKEILGERNFKDVKGLAYKDKDDAHINEPREFIQDLDDLPMPFYKGVPIKKYKPYAYQPTQTLPFMTLFSSRGCPFNCIFCETKVMCGKKVRFHSPQRVIDDILYLNSEFGVRNFQFFDDTLTVNKKRVEKICELIKENNLDISWNCLSRVDTINTDLLKKMNAAGCELIAFGVESGDDTILKNIRKGCTTVQAEAAFKAAREANMVIRAFFMIGNPEETKETVLKTIQFSKYLDPDFVNFSITTPFPNSELWDLYEKAGYIKHDAHTDFTMFHKPAINLPGLSSEELSDFAKRAHSEFYLRPGYILRRLKEIKNFGQFKAKFLAGAGIILDEIIS
ncbi:MAG: radical SAM protein [Candidatus Methanoperedens sp.]|nr:radical SAM protein [Candidatus Methanoperedens sp.]